MLIYLVYIKLVFSYLEGLVSYQQCTLNYFPFNCLACGVAHQALEEIEPAGDNILIQGELNERQCCAICDDYLIVVWIGCGPVGLFGVGLARAMGATTM